MRGSRGPDMLPGMPEKPETILIRGGRVIDPASGHDATADVLIEDGCVAAIGPGLGSAAADRVIEAGDRIVTPGLIDPHVHFRQPGGEHKESIRSGSLAAAAGGFTAVCCMPNTLPPLDTPEILASIADRARSASCRVFVAACATAGRKGATPSEIPLLAKAGAVAFTDDGNAVPTAGVMGKVLALVRETGRVFMQHCEDETLTGGAPMHAGELSLRLGLRGWPREAEEITLERDLRLNRRIGCRYHAQHLSSAGSVELIERSRAEGQPVSAEVSPHHLTLTVEACAGLDPNAKMNPPLRERHDVEALRDAVARGVITVLATDHAPHAREEKAEPFEAAPYGVIGLETALALNAGALVETGLIGWPRLVALMTIEPARLLGVDEQGLGRLEVGGVADVTIIDPGERWEVCEETLAGRSVNTPFMGRELTGRAVMTIVGGRVVHDSRALIRAGA